ncbi:hypothetical protein L207DRAFT_221131 [Hyaloscypha variabilis F]|uniref:DUF7730 domain-containing protein n=1 Tax=Hyaloscypha variabilis (strain UAMH 11265 / GT02V1 / F) TaxID=1149755 RepID=A0A2J6S7R0_HYAVF|nr:hypothetical protein L207DRAFT_221131 [Hyaloscypha variabilis F]
MPLLTAHHRRKLRERSMLAITIVCLPCICLIGTCILLSHAVCSLQAYELPSTRKKRNLEVAEREKRRRTPWVLAPRIGSERNLTIGNECSGLTGLGTKIRGGRKEGKKRDGDVEVGKGRGKIEWQEQSPLFNLPLELRRQIYEEAIGGYTLHVFTLDAYRRMAHTRCKTAVMPEYGNCSCAARARQKGVCDEWGNSELLALLMSCRRIYSEAIEILYSKNTFTFSSMAPLISHLLNIPPQRVAVMRDVKWRMFIGADQWCTDMPWLECRIEGRRVADEAGCACYLCWPKEIASDTRVSCLFFDLLEDLRAEACRETNGAYSLMIGYGTAG